LALLRGAAAAAADGDNPARENETQLGQARDGPAPDQLDPLRSRSGNSDPQALAKPSHQHFARRAAKRKMPLSSLWLGRRWADRALLGALEEQLALACVAG